MAERRMFAQKIITSDRFLDLPFSAQALYFQLSMQADDDGLVDGTKKILRMAGAADSDLRALEAAGLVLVFESGVAAIRHWRVNNRIQRDRYKPSLCVREVAQLRLDPAGAYEIVPETPCVQNGSKLDTDWIQIGSRLDPKWTQAPCPRAVAPADATFPRLAGRWKPPHPRRRCARTALFLYPGRPLSKKRVFHHRHPPSLVESWGKMAYYGISPSKNRVSTRFFASPAGRPGAKFPTVSSRFWRKIGGIFKFFPKKTCNHYHLMVI